MAKKKKKHKSPFIKEAKKIFKQKGTELAIGLITGIATNFITDATEKLLAPRKKRQGSKQPSRS